jgi:thiol-disulfide isomerase/thioredoxin
MVDFGVPKGLAAPFGILLPIVELLVALALLTRAFAYWGGIGAFSLLVIFIIGIGVTLARGQAPDCHCFGKLSKGPIGFKTIARNTIFCAMATVIVQQGPRQPGMLEWTARFSGTQLSMIFGGCTLFLLLILNLFLLLQIIKQNGRTLLRIEALEAKAGGNAEAPAPAAVPVGSPAPEIELPDLEGNKVELKSFSGNPMVALFWNPGCGFCQKMLEPLKAWENNGGFDSLKLLVVSTGSVEDNQAQGFRSRVVLDSGFSAGNKFGASGTPSAIKIDGEGNIASSVVVGADEVMKLLAT